MRSESEAREREGVCEGKIQKIRESEASEREGVCEGEIQKIRETKKILRGRTRKNNRKKREFKRGRKL